MEWLDALTSKERMTDYTSRLLSLVRKQWEKPKKELQHEGYRHTQQLSNDHDQRYDLAMIVGKSLCGRWRAVTQTALQRPTMPKSPGNQGKHRLLVSDLVGDFELISVLIKSFMMSANEQDCVRALIEMYRSLPCLWKIKSADYSNRYKKKDAYEKLVAIYKEHHPTETVDEHIVRKKIQALRTVYKKELNKVEKSLKSGAGTDDVYVPKLWYYDLLAFTRDQEIPRPCQTVTSICAPSPEENLPESPDEHVPLQQRERPEGNDVQSHQSSRSPCLEDQRRPQRPSRKRKSTAGTPVDLLAMANNILSKHAATQLSAFPTLVEERLKKLDVTQRSHAERLMFDVLNAAAAGKLSDTSMLNITERQPSSQFYLGPPQEPMHSTPVRRPGPHHSQFWTPPAPPSFADFSQGPPTSTDRYSEMGTYYQNL
ncbi:unnamed protein product [Ranitomeya imitator]|uniref:MADF domain-containing protein n=2 Tax=Ranitomeya imitator TaxID=111125 RepID=A0ABN9M9U7_9NEOB|nr:unnamed protein product [Ranitomeya imitator]